MHLLATWELGRGYEHMGVLARVSRALRAKGHRVTLAARYPDLAAATCAGDFDAVVPAPRFDGLTDLGVPVTYAQVVAAGGFASAETLRPLLACWLAMIETARPDAVLAAHAPASLLAARLVGLPAWRIGSGFDAPLSQDVGTSLMPWSTIAPEVLAGAATASDSAVRILSNEALGGLAELLAGTPRLATTWAELDPFAGEAPASAYHGDLGGLELRGSSEPLDWSCTPGARVLVYMPPDHGPGLALREALARLRWPTIWYWRGATGSDAEGTLRYRPDPADFAQSAAGVRIFVSRAEHGTTARMLRAGVPQMLVPDTPESQLLAHRLSSAGLAVTRPADALPSDFTRALIQLASGERDDALTRVRRKYAAYDPERAARRIAATITGGSARPRRLRFLARN